MEIEPMRGSAYLRVMDDAKVRCSTEPGGDWTSLTILGPVEVELDLSRSAIERCRDLLSEALVTIDQHAPETSTRELPSGSGASG